MVRSQSVALVLLIIGLTGCATFPPSTGFVPEDSSGFGFKIEDVGQGIYRSWYKGNNNTRADSAMAYSILAAFEFCEVKEKLALTGQTQNASTRETYSQVSGYSTPVYGRRGLIGYSSNVYSFPVTNVYPAFYTPFECRSRFVGFKKTPTFEVIGRELVHAYTKDFKGGLLVKEIKDEHKGQPFLAEDVLLKVNGARVENENDLYTTLETVKGSSTEIEIIRGQKIQRLQASIEDNTDLMRKFRDDMLGLLCPKAPDGEEETSIGGVRPLSQPQICRGRVASVLNPDKKP